MDGAAAANPKHVALILRRIEALPTLPSVAMRLLALTADDESHAAEVIELVGSDPALTARLLTMCRSAEKGVASDVVSVERAVMLLGFTAVRNAVLSIQVVEMFRRRGDGADPVIDHAGFWRHCLAVAVAAELIAQAHPQCRDVSAGDAFVCGLLHDVGKLALAEMLPRSYARVVELADLNQADISGFERSVVGLDHHTAGKRLAEQWGLAPPVRDSVWLHGCPYDTVPELEHRRLVGLIGLADLAARHCHLGFSGNYDLFEDPAERAEELGFRREIVDEIRTPLFEQLEARCGLLGLDDQPSHELYVDSITQANRALARVNAALERRGRSANRQARMIAAIDALHADPTAGGLPDALDAVARSAASLLGDGYLALVHLPSEPAQAPGLLARYGRGGAPLDTAGIDDPQSWQAGDREVGAGGILVDAAPAWRDHLAGAVDAARVKWLLLTADRFGTTLLLYDHGSVDNWASLRVLVHSWSAVITAASEHEASRRLGEQLVASNRALARTRQQLVDSETLIRLGEIAAGAAHEMNNPLAVICGRGQLLAIGLEHGTEHQKAAAMIVMQAEKLSEMISSLHHFANPPVVERAPTDVTALLHGAVARARHDLGPAADKVEIFVRTPPGEHEVAVDPEQMEQALVELIINAVRARPRTAVEVTAKLDTEQDHLVISVSDDGFGMERDVLAHAFDPFFSAHKAGRRNGMGLTRVRQCVQGHGGEIRLQSNPEDGTVALVVLPFRAATAGENAGATRSNGVPIRPI